MSELPIVIAMAIVCLLAAAALIWRSGIEKERQAVVMQRVNSTLARFDADGNFVPQSSAEGWQPPLLENLFRRAGFAPSLRLYLLFVAPGLLLALAALVLGFKPAVAALLIYPLGVMIFLNWRTEYLRDLTVKQLPDFIDSVVRIVSIGCSLELAFRNATEECREPLRGLFTQVLLRTHAGMSLEDAISQVADNSGIKELKFMASVFVLGVRYGGSPNAILERIALTLRERERSQKELRALTAETRVSAMILSALPILVAVMSLWSNPHYLHSMWLTESGQHMLLAAGGLEIIGMLLLYRMAKV